MNEAFPNAEAGGFLFEENGAPDVILARLPGFIQEFSSSPNTSTSEYQAMLILPDFLYELVPDLRLNSSLIKELTEYFL